MPSVRAMMWHIPHRLALRSCVPAAPLGTAASAHGEARCQPHGGSRVVGVGGSAGQGTGYPESCHLWVVMTCSVTNRRLGGLGTGLLPALLMHRIAAGNGLKLPAVVWAAQAGSASAGKLRLGFVFSRLPCIWCGRGGVFPYHGSHGAVVKGEPLSALRFGTSEALPGHKAASALI